MLTARVAGAERVVLARDAAASEGPFLCPGCGETLTLKKGSRVVHHFAHRPPVTCSWAAGESHHHMRCKLEIHDLLRARRDMSKVALERPLGEVRPDVSAKVRDDYVAIEVQRSNLSVNDIAHRTSAYAKRNIHVLWLALDRPFSTTPTGPRHSPRPWELWLHAAYCDRVYYWQGGLDVVPVHFDEFLLYRPEAEWRDGGETMTGGGFSYPAKRWRTPVPGPVMPLTDFAAYSLSGRRRDGVRLPPMRVWMDSTTPWWAPPVKERRRFAPRAP